MKAHNPDYANQSVQIEVAQNGYILTYQDSAYQLQKKLCPDIGTLTNAVARALGLLSVGETITVKESK